MQSVYEAATALDAHMILNLLMQEGIDGRVDGEYLPAAVGEIPVMNMVRVMVEESDYQRAAQIVRDWEAIEVASEKRVKPASSGISKFVLGLVVGGGSVLWVYNSPVSYDGLDLNGDGILDEKWIYSNDLITRVEIDKNFDQKVDLILYYDHRGIVKRSEIDLNFDGVFETETRYKNGLGVSENSDLNQDGSVDYKVSFKHDLVDEVEIIGEGGDLRSKRQKYRMGKLISAELDADGDGVFDIEYVYDNLEEIESSIDKRLNLDVVAID